MMRTLFAALLAATFGLVAGACGRSEPTEVPACQAWIERYTKCIEDKAPPSQRQQLIAMLRQATDTWAGVASGAEGRKALEAACRSLVESSRRATEALGCAW